MCGIFCLIRRSDLVVPIGIVKSNGDVLVFGFDFGNAHHAHSEHACNDNEHVVSLWSEQANDGDPIGGVTSVSVSVAAEPVDVATDADHTRSATMACSGPK